MGEAVGQHGDFEAVHGHVVDFQRTVRFHENVQSERCGQDEDREREVPPGQADAGFEVRIAAEAVKHPASHRAGRQHGQVSGPVPGGGNQGGNRSGRVGDEEGDGERDRTGQAEQGGPTGGPFAGEPQRDREREQEGHADQKRVERHEGQQIMHHRPLPVLQRPVRAHLQHVDQVDVRLDQ